MIVRWVKRCLRAFGSQEAGLTLLETVAATALLGIVATSLLSSLSLIARSNFLITRMSTAEALAVSQMEHIKSSSYIDYSISGHGEYELLATPTQYTIHVDTQPIDSATGQPLGSDQDDGTQIITATVAHLGDNVTALVGYKVNR